MLKSWSKTHSTLQQGSWQLQKQSTRMSAAIRAVEPRCASGIAQSPGCQIETREQNTLSPRTAQVTTGKAVCGSTRMYWRLQDSSSASVRLEWARRLLNRNKQENNIHSALEERRPQLQKQSVRISLRIWAVGYIRCAPLMATYFGNNLSFPFTCPTKQDRITYKNVAARYIC